MSRRYQVHYGRGDDGAGYTVRDGGFDGPIVFRSDNKSETAAEADRLNAEVQKKILIFQVKRTEVLEYRIRFDGDEPPWTEEELALGRGLQEANDMECDEEYGNGVVHVCSDVVWESPDELVPNTYRVEVSS